MNQSDNNDNNPINSFDANRPKDNLHSDEDKHTANMYTIICLILFFSGPLLIELLFKNQTLVDALGDHIKIVCLLFASMPLLAIVILADIRHKYPWHNFSAGVMGFFIVCIILLVIAIITFVIFFFKAIIACVGLTIECCGVLTALD